MLLVVVLFPVGVSGRLCGWKSCCFRLVLVSWWVGVGSCVVGSGVANCCWRGIMLLVAESHVQDV